MKAIKNPAGVLTGFKTVFLALLIVAAISPVAAELRNIDSVTIDVSKDKVEVGNNVKIDGEVEGNGLTAIRAAYRFKGKSVWHVLKSEENSCSGSSCSITAEFPGDSDLDAVGPGEIEFQIKGEAGELSSNSVVKTVEIVEATKPAISDISFSYPGDEPNVGEKVEIQVQATDDNDLDSINVIFNGVELGPKDCSSTFCYRTFSQTPSFASRKKVNIVVEDSAGNRATERRFIEVKKKKNHPPSVSLTTPKDHATFSLPKKFKWSINDPDGDDVTKTIYIERKSSPDDEPWESHRHELHLKKTVPKNTLWIFNGDGDFKKGATYVWGVKVTDEHGKFKKSNVRSFTLKEEEPEETRISNIRPRDGSRVSNPVTVSVDINREADSHTCYWGFDSYPFGENRMSRSGNTFTDAHSFSGKNPGIHVSCWDSDGSRTNTLSTSFTVSGEKNTEEEGDIVIRVEEKDGDRLKNAEVTVKNSRISKFDRTNSNGESRFNNLEEDTYTVRAECLGATVSDTDFVEAGSTSYVTLKFDRFFSPDDCIHDDGNNPPDADLDISPRNADVNERIRFDARDSSDTDGSIVKYRFDFDGDGDFDRTDFDGVVREEFSGEFSGSARVKVYDNEGATDTASRSYTVGRDTSNERPVARLSISPDTAEINERITFDARDSTDKDGSIDRYRFDFDNDGDWDRTDFDGRTTRSFSSEFSGNARVEVRDNDGATDTAKSFYRVVEEPEETECDIRANSLRLDEDEIDEGDSTDARIEVENNMDEDQRIKVTFSADGDVIDIDEEDIDGNDDREFSAEIKSRYEDNGGEIDVDAEVETLGDPCGDTRVATRSAELDIKDAEDRDGKLAVIVKDIDGDRIEDARVRVENGDDETDFTDEDGESVFWLEPDEYTVTVSEDGFENEREEIDIDSGDRHTLVFRLEREDRERGLEITKVDHPASVCRGGSFTADVTVENRGGFHEFVTLVGMDIDGSPSTRFSLGRDDIVTKQLRFTNVQGSGSTEFRIRARNHEDDTVTRSINVKSCGPTDTDGATGIQMQVDQSRVTVGQPVKVTGYVDGVESSKEVKIRIGGRTAGTALTQPDGFFQVFVRPEEVGRQVLTATSGGASSSTEIQVTPTARVDSATAKDKVFQGETFEICGDVSSQITPKVYLLDNGKVVESRNAKGKVCFERTASETGTHKYEIRAVTYGTSGSATTTVKVLETAPETTSFPSQVASVESGSGIVKVELYNTHDSVRRYSIRLEGLPDGWTSQSEKEVVLPKGDRKTVYFYLTPKDEGEFEPTIEVEASGSTIYRDKIRVYSGGTDKPQRKPLLSRLLDTLF